jgi:hypothetical protein
MESAQLPGLVSGGYISQYLLDLHTGTFSLRVDVANETVISYHLQFDKLSHFAVDSERDTDKERLEVTEMWIDATPESSSTEEWSVIISMWDLTHIRLNCARISVNGTWLR